MANMPSIAIFVHAGDPEPTVFSTAGSKQEQRQLHAWLLEHPDLDRLVQLAWALTPPTENG